MVVCAYVVMSWFIVLAFSMLIVEFTKIKASNLNIIHSIVLIIMSILGIIGVAYK